MQHELAAVNVGEKFLACAIDQNAIRGVRAACWGSVRADGWGCAISHRDCSSGGNFAIAAACGDSKRQSDSRSDEL